MAATPAVEDRQELPTRVAFAYHGQQRGDVQFELLLPGRVSLVEALNSGSGGARPDLDVLYDAAIRDTIAQFESTVSPVITDGEQRKYHNFWTYGFHSPAAQNEIRRREQAEAALQETDRRKDEFLAS